MTPPCSRWRAHTLRRHGQGGMAEVANTTIQIHRLRVQAAAAMISSTDPGYSNALAHQPSGIKARGHQYPISAIVKAFIPTGR